MPPELIKFKEFELDCGCFELRQAGRAVKLEKIPMELLMLLAAAEGRLVSREEIEERLWGVGVSVDAEHGINTAIRKIRQALGDDPERPQFVQTVQRKGYRFIAAATAIHETKSQNDGAATGEESIPSRVRESSQTKVLEPEVVAADVGPVPEKRVSRRFVWIGVAAALLLSWSLYKLAQPARSIVLAVLPFDNLSGDAAQEYLSDGITEEMIMQVGRVHLASLRVIGRTSSMLFKGKAKSVEQVGRQLDVDYILSGSVRRAGGRIRVTAELVRVRDQVQLWDRSYDRELRDVIDLQSEIARTIAAELPVSLSGKERVGAVVSQPVKPEAYESYLKGLYFWSRWTLDAQGKAIDAFKKALAEDPSYAPAWAFLGSAITISAHMRGLPAAEAMVKARAALSRALELDPASPEAQAHDGWLKLTYEWDLEGARADFERALALNPSLASAQEGLSLCLAATGGVEESVAAMRRARELDPLSMVVSADLCLVLYYARRYDEAIAQCQRAVAMDPGSLPAHLFLKRLYSVEGKQAQAIEAEIKAMSVNFGGEPWFGKWSERLRSAYRTSGWEAARRQQIEWMLAAPSTAQRQAYSIAEEYAMLGDRKNALDWLEKACDERRYHLVFLRVDPLFDQLRDEPRFSQLLRRVGLPP